MPTFADKDSGRPTGRVSYAEEAEVLEFANKMRVAGDADPLDALMPSRPRFSNACLIANAVNFKSVVQVLWEKEHDADTPLSEFTWVMILPKNMTKARAEQIASGVECPVIRAWYKEDGPAWKTEPADDSRFHHQAERRWMIQLPQKIGNSAAAFDRGRGWTKKYAAEGSSFYEY